MSFLPITAQASDVSVRLDGELVDVEPILRDGRTLLPARAIVETLGGEVDWDDKTRQVTLVHGNTVILLTIGSATAYVNDTAVELDVPAQIIENRTFLPLRFVGESLGLDIDWEDDTHTVIITTGVGCMETPPDQDQALVGTWYWYVTALYVFEADGQGTSWGEDMRWWTSDGVLYICVSPDLCGNSCIAPRELDYLIAGDRLTLTERMTLTGAGDTTFRAHSKTRSGAGQIWRDAYVFSADGQGMELGQDIRWWVSDGVLYVCCTPDVCGDSCPAPVDWYYVFEGNQLILTNTTSSTFTRG